MRQLGYTRVSTSSQDAQLQLDALIAAGVQKRDVFADVTSGSKTAIERPGMKRLLEYAMEGDTVVVWRVDRLGRSLIDVLNTVTMLRDRGIHIRSISDGIDPATSTGRLMLNMLATLAEDERELIVERVNAGIAAARQNGTRLAP
ncbi:DNA invertase Pin-like site-specific DNA recombinase [Arthrobacter oryzae]|nr:DNA invertase Pin-like site-specific DNA recombinase [Arthrobacter oryzae]